MTSLITAISTLAAIIGIVTILPQLLAMVRARTAGGQSPLGWLLGAATNLGMAFVNGVAYHAPVLAGGNLISLTGCLTAVMLIYRFRGASHRTTTTIEELHTHEFVALRDRVAAEHHRRTGEPVFSA